MRFRLKVVGYLIFLSLGLLYLGLARLSFAHDKILHAVGLFMFSGLLYWTIDMPRKRTIAFTAAISLVACVGSEFLQAALSSRVFDKWDIAANLVGSGASIAANTMLHNRVLEVRRKSRFDRMRTHVYDQASQMELDDIV